ALLWQASPALEATLRTMFREAFQQGGEGWVEDSIATLGDWGFRLADVRRPVAVWRGDADRMSSAAHSGALASGLPDATLHVVAGAGHSLPVIAWSAILDSVLVD